MKNKKKQNQKYDGPSDSALLLIGIIFAILIQLRMETGMVIFGYLSIVPAFFIVVIVFDRLLNLK